MDFLGLANLTILGRAIDIIRARHGVEIDLDTMPLDDARTFEMLAAGETIGVFQLESAGMRRLLQDLTPGQRSSDLIGAGRALPPGADGQIGD